MRRKKEAPIIVPGQLSPEQMEALRILLSKPKGDIPPVTQEVPPEPPPAPIPRREADIIQEDKPKPKEEIKFAEEDKKLDWAFEPMAKPPRFFNRYPMIAILLETRAGGGTYAFFDRIGRFKKKMGLGFEYRLKKKKKKLPTAQFENLIESNKGRVIIIDHPEEDVFRPIKYESQKISVKETAWKEIFMNNVERAHILLTRRGFMEKYMPLILLIVFGVMMIMALYVVRTDIALIIDQVRIAVSGAAGAVGPPPL